MILCIANFWYNFEILKYMYKALYINEEEIWLKLSIIVDLKCVSIYSV